MADQEFNLEDSHDMIVPVDWLPRQKSSDSIFNDLIRVPSYGQRDLIFPYNPVNGQQKQFSKVFKSKQKKVKLKKPCDYRKNICGYITKKIIRQYLSPIYQQKVEGLCQKYGCGYATSKSYFLSRIQRITGPSHVPALFIPQEQRQIPIKQAFKEFFLWFVKERYLRYLILEGKMQQKLAYIQYKNTILMALVNQPEVKNDQSSSQLQQSQQKSE